MLKQNIKFTYEQKAESGFTLIELSIVLVIIGLIVGGVLVGQDLIAAAAMRAQISQIEKYNTAVHTFQGKYGYLPGDMPDPQASSFGFIARGTGLGQGDGNGLLAGGNADCCAEVYGEIAVFWVDLSQAGYIDGSFTTATSSTHGGSMITGTAIANYMPAAKIGQGNYVYVWAGGSGSVDLPGMTFSGINYFGLSGIADLQVGIIGFPDATKNLTQAQAYNIDQKIDDGYPTTGSVLAVYPSSSSIYWAAGGNIDSTGTAPGQVFGSGYQISAVKTTCFDNNNVSGAQMRYTMSISNGSNMSCVLAFKFQ